MEDYMSLEELRSYSDNFTDETLSPKMMLDYANSALAYANSEIGLKLPRIKEARLPYEALDWHWFVRLISPYMSYGIKMNDGSLSEADRYYQEFLVAIGKLRKDFKKILDPDHIDSRIQDAGHARIESGRGIPINMRGGGF